MKLNRENELELDLQQQIARRETIAQLSRRLSSILDLDELLHETVSLVAEAFDFYSVAIFLLDEASDEVVLRAVAGRAQQATVGAYRQAVGQGIIGWVAQTEEPLVANDVREEPRYMTYLPDTRSELAIPLKHMGQMLGVVDVQSDHIDAFNQDDIMTLGILAGQVAVTIENANLYASQDQSEQILRRWNEELSVLHCTALAGTEATDVDELIERTTKILADTLYQENVGFLLLDPEKDVLRPHPSYYGVSDTLRRETVLPLGIGISGQVAQTGQPLVVANVHESSHYVEVSSTVRSELCVPVRVQGEVAGVINVEAPELDGFSEADVRLVSTVAEHVGSALERLRLFEEMQRRNEELSARNAIAHAVSRSLDIDDVLEQLYHEVDRLLAPDTFVVVLYNEGDEVFDVALVVEHDERLPRFSAQLDETGGLTAWVIRECQPLLAHDLLEGTEDLPASPQHVGKPARSWMGVPLVTRDRIVGVLSVQSFKPSAFDERDQRFLSAVADQVAVAIDNARLYEKTRLMAFTDGLTGLYNSRHFYQALEREVARSRRYGHQVSLIILDLDNFKKYNDQYGHLAGDDLLKTLANLLTSVIRRADVAARYGGEEFVIILPETTSHAAAQLAERLREIVEGHEFQVHNEHVVGRITISLGVAAYPESATNPKDLVNQADMALLEAKSEKNKVCIFSPGASLQERDDGAGEPHTS